MRAAIVLIALTATSPALARGSSPPAESAASDTLVVNGSFERGPRGTPLVILSAGSTAIPGWTVGRNDIDYITTYWQASNGSRSIDLSGFGPGSLVQELQGLAVGRKYRVIFDMAGNPDDGSPAPGFAGARPDHPNEMGPWSWAQHQRATTMPPDGPTTGSLRAPSLLAKLRLPDVRGR